MSEFRADLHCHSTCSDGSDTPLELLQRAKKVGLQGLSITDHDTIDAYSPELFASAEELGILLLPGVEISSEFKNINVHILGYGFEVDALKPFLKEMQVRRVRRNRSILQKLAQCKMPIGEEELTGVSIGRPHIAELMVKKGYVSTLQEAFERYLKEGAPCYASGFKYTPREVIAEIHKAEGKAILAHPHFFKERNFLRELLALPFDGIECYYAALPKAMEEPWLEIAKKRNWIATGGSDYHGAHKPHITLGASWVDREIFERLRPGSRRNAVD